eukprot:CAMPEP_0198285426 /NCGR_PEP_ID=MMETSP1449-20131203/4713_1 /TAXON_ID=420275 /ORGANISM="Attheya septentrionalis, Strain CCMP2084" /LENGTH=253 /DNA_ID=CAMNT_0043982833 /DNA_START=27 /DNA_END=788 /DNA_ORIENTATION=+
MKCWIVFTGLLVATTFDVGTSADDAIISAELKAQDMIGRPHDSNQLRSQQHYQERIDSDDSFVFLQKFPLEHSDGLFFHTEVLVCPRDNFSTEDQAKIDDLVSSLDDTSFVEIKESWWSTRTANCVEMGYGGAPCKERCCAVPHGPDQVNFSLNERRAVISNADLTQKSLFLYGRGTLDGEAAYHATCDQTCWSNWAGTDYNPLTNNCNTFTSTVLHCIFGLSEKKPNLGPSDMVTVTCDKCPSPSLGTASTV